MFKHNIKRSATFTMVRMYDIAKYMTYVIYFIYVIVFLQVYIHVMYKIHGHVKATLSIS